MRGTNGSNAFDANDARIELLRAVGLCHPGWTGLQRVTFSPDKFSAPEWLGWKEGLFSELFLPRIQEARSAAVAGDWRSLADCDRAMDAALDSCLGEASFLAGRRLLAGYGPPRSERLWTRYDGLVNSGKAPGHLAILCAVRGAIFHLPPAAILGAYIFLEARGGLPEGGVERWISMVDDCLAKTSCQKTSNLRAA